MGFDMFLNHQCDIYHLKKEGENLGYGLPDSPSFYYSASPDISNQPCHFALKGETGSVIQLEPQAKMEARIKLTLPAGVDVRINDKVCDKATGYSYTAEVPRDIRGHHITVMLYRSKEQELL